MKVHFFRCFTGRRWININKGWLAIGFMGLCIDRVMWRGRYVYLRRTVDGRSGQAAKGGA